MNPLFAKFLKAPRGSSTIGLQSGLVFVSDDDKTAFITHLGISGSGGAPQVPTAIWQADPIDGSASGGNHFSTDATSCNATTSIILGADVLGDLTDNPISLGTRLLMTDSAGVVRIFEITGVSSPGSLNTTLAVQNRRSISGNWSGTYALSFMPHIISATANLLCGDNAGNIISSGIDPSAVVQRSEISGYAPIDGGTFPGSNGYVLISNGSAVAVSTVNLTDLSAAVTAAQSSADSANNTFSALDSALGSTRGVVVRAGSGATNLSTFTSSGVLTWDSDAGIMGTLSVTAAQVNASVNCVVSVATGGGADGPVYYSGGSLTKVDQAANISGTVDPGGSLNGSDTIDASVLGAWISDINTKFNLVLSALIGNKTISS